MGMDINARILATLAVVLVLMVAISLFTAWAMGPDDEDGDDD